MSKFREELAWAAGFFDGEGTFYGKTTRNGRNRGGFFRASVPQVNKDTLERFQAAVLGLGSICLRSRHLAKPTHQPCYVWQVQNWRDTQAVMCMLWPFLGSYKKQQALAAIEAFRLDPGWGRTARSKSEIKPNCHPTKKHRGKGKCAACYQRDYRAKLAS